MIERFTELFVSTVLALPRPVLSLLAGPAIQIDGRPLDPQLQVLLRLMSLAGMPDLARGTAEQARRMYSGSAGQLSVAQTTMAKVEDRSINGPHGPIGLRIYTPRSRSRSLPIVVYYHGGGWVIGDVDTHDRPCRALADQVGAVVVSVDYRLAPENRFPAAVDDALAAYLWVREHAADIGADGTRVAVAGDSAGGNLAAVVCQQSRSLSCGPPSFQLLIYPATDLGRESESYSLFADGFLLTRDQMRWFIGHYLGEADAADPRASPLCCDDLSGLPPAMVMTAGFDPLRDEGRDYADKLLEAGVEVGYRHYPTLIHGFVSLTGVVDDAALAFKEGASALRVSFEN